MSTNPPPPLAMPEPGPGRPTAVCRECGCENDWSASECWLCGRANWRTDGQVFSVKGEPPVQSGLNIVTVMLAIVIVAILLGIGRESPELAIGLGVCAVAACIHTTIRVRRFRQMNVPVTSMRAFGLFLGSWLISVFLSLLLLFLFSVAVAIALFGYCACTMR